MCAFVCVSACDVCAQASTHKCMLVYMYIQLHGEEGRN